MRHSFALLAFVFFINQLFNSCGGDPQVIDFSDVPNKKIKLTDMGPLEYGPINEASGIAASSQQKGVLWVHNDSGDTTCLYAVNDKGKHLGVFYIEGAKHRDWEDIAIGPGPRDGQSYLYIGEIGDNSAVSDWKYIYRVPEPKVVPSQRPVNTVLGNVETITYQYIDGNRDAETVMVDPLTKDIYVVSKREDSVGVYIAPFPQSTTAPMTLEKVATIPIHNVTAGDISPSGNGVLIKTYNTIYYWSRRPGQQLWKVFEKQPRRLPYQKEPQGEAVCWHPGNIGYYTVSEEADDIPARLYLYSID